MNISLQKIGFNAARTGPKKIAVWFGIATPDLESFLSVAVVRYDHIVGAIRWKLWWKESDWKCLLKMGSRPLLVILGYPQIGSTNWLLSACCPADHGMSWSFRSLRLKGGGSKWNRWRPLWTFGLRSLSAKPIAFEECRRSFGRYGMNFAQFLWKASAGYFKRNDNKLVSNRKCWEWAAAVRFSRRWLHEVFDRNMIK